MFDKPSRSANVGPVPFLELIGRRCATRTGAVMMATFGRVFARSHLNVVGSAIVGWGSCLPLRASQAEAPERLPWVGCYTASTGFAAGTDGHFAFHLALKV